MTEQERKEAVLERKKHINHVIIKKKAKTKVLDAICIIVGCSVGAFATQCILLPNGLTTGGATGITRLIEMVIPWDVSFNVIYYIFCVTILLLVWIFLGFREMRKILLLAIVYPIFMFIFGSLNYNLMGDSNNDTLLAAIYFGVFTGVSLGVVYWRGFSYAGTDGLSKIIRLRLFPHVGQNKILLVIDGTTVVLSAALFGRDIALYALISQFIVSKCVDVVLYGLDTKLMRLEIITDHEDAIIDFVLNEMNRGLTIHHVKGAYTGRDRDELHILCSQREALIVRRAIADFDKTALITVSKVEGVWGHGKGFKKNDKFNSL